MEHFLDAIIKSLFGGLLMFVVGKFLFWFFNVDENFWRDEDFWKNKHNK